MTLEHLERSERVQDPDVIEAATVGVPHDVKGQAILAVVVVREGLDFGSIRSRVAAGVRTSLGPAIVPEQFVPVAELPKTRSGKVLGRVIRAPHLGEPLGDHVTRQPLSLTCLPSLASES
jgi:acetyl-CoA synthetase